jgi:rhodanese-related sulfurtransferase
VITVDARTDHLALAEWYAAAPNQWPVAPRFNPRQRWYHRISHTADHEVWLLTVIERNVLEWRLDPRSDARLSFADSYDLEVIVTCQEGYASSLAAASLQDLGLHRATDLGGGFVAWRSAGFPTSGGTR